MNPNSHIHIFAYGSNMCTERLQARVPSATPVTTGYVLQRRFAFHKRSEDGSAKADATSSSSTSDRIWGVVFRLHIEEKPVLDEHEFLGIGYDEELVEVVHEDGVIESWIYVAREEAIDPSLLPYSWYHDFILHGARQHGLPDDYLEFLQRFQSIEDRHTSRHTTNRSILEGSFSDSVTSNS
jgi:hypothetical protein